MKATVTFLEGGITTVADITIQENLTLDIAMPLTKQTFELCSILGLTISILHDADENFGNGDTLIIDTQVVPEAIEMIEFEIK